MLDNRRVSLIGNLMILLSSCDAGGAHLLIRRDVRMYRGLAIAPAGSVGRKVNRSTVIPAAKAEPLSGSTNHIPMGVCR